MNDRGTRVLASERACQELADLRAAIAQHRAELTKAHLRWGDAAAGLEPPQIVTADRTLWEQAGLETQHPYSDLDPIGRLLGLVDHIRDDTDEWRERCTRYARAIDAIEDRLKDAAENIEHVTPDYLRTLVQTVVEQQGDPVPEPEGGPS